MTQPNPYEAPNSGQSNPYSEPKYMPSQGAMGQPPASPYGQFSTQYTQPNYTQPYPTQQYGQYGEVNVNANEYSAGYGTVIPLKPLGIGDTIDAAFRLLKFNPGAYFIFPFIVMLIANILTALISLAMGDSTSIFSTDFVSNASSVFGASLPLTLIIDLLASVIISVVGTRVTLASVRGQKISIGKSFAMIKPRFWSLFWKIIVLSIIYAIAVVIIGGIILAVTIGALSGATADPLSSGETPVGFVLGILGALVLIYLIIGLIYLRFALASSAIVAEGAGPIKSLKRSWNLTRGSFGYILGTVIIVTLMVGVVLGVVTAIFSTISLIAIGSSGENIVGVLVGALGMSVIISIVITPLQCVMQNLIYVNMRFKRENFHQQLWEEIGQ